MVKPDVSVKLSKKQSFLSAKTKFLNTRLMDLAENYNIKSSENKTED